MMNNVDKLTRLVLFAIIAAIVFLLLTEWTQFSEEFDTAQNQLKQTAESVSYPSNPQQSASDDAQTFTETTPSIPREVAAEHFISSDETAATINPAAESNRYVVLENNTLKIIVNKLGGDIVEVAMKKHLTSLENDATPLKLLEKNALRTYTAQSGLIGDEGSNVKSARAVFSSEKNYYSVDGDESLSVDLIFNDSNGVKLIKTFSLSSNSYVVNVDYKIDNRSKQVWNGTFYSQISRDNSEDPGTESSGFGMQSYLGTATTTADSPYKKISFKDIEKEGFRNKHSGGWVAMIQHYFVSAWIPNSEEPNHYFTKKSKNGLNIIGFYSDPLTVQSGSSTTIGAKFYAGPKDQYTLAKIAKHLDLTVDYGWLWMIAQPLYALLNMFATGDLHAFDKVFQVFPGFHNWGIAIIMLTVVVKAVFFKLSAASYRSMANMRRVQPKLLALRERYANDKAGQSKAMMELYQKEKINPLGGCLPILIQMPVFIALYWALMESVELRHASFLWLKDLSVMDPYFILPVLMGATMWFQQKMNPAPPDPIQAKVMQWMPIIFTFFFLWFPAGLVVYWVSNNILSIAQQWVITRNIEKAAAAKA